MTRPDRFSYSNTRSCERENAITPYQSKIALHQKAPKRHPWYTTVFSKTGVTIANCQCVQFIIQSLTRRARPSHQPTHRCKRSCHIPGSSSCSLRAATQLGLQLAVRARACWLASIVQVAGCPRTARIAMRGRNAGGSFRGGRVRIGAL